mmetsp:Transcript_30085/g.30571  ORF Transcript_30085/g.30571 Transcript_30085/m.30571 type:complete len:83 (+) Transcript_30085:438-686(+)
MVTVNLSTKQQWVGVDNTPLLAVLFPSPLGYFDSCGWNNTEMPMKKISLIDYMLLPISSFLPSFYSATYRDGSLPTLDLSQE